MKDRLDVILTEKGFSPSREKAKAAIMAGVVFVDGQKIDKAGTPVDSEAEIVQNFLASSAGNPLDLANFTDDIEDDEKPEFVLKVYQEIIHKD